MRNDYWMARILLVPLALALGGCFIAGGLRSMDTPIEIESARAPREAAACLARNAEASDTFGSTPAQWREGAKPGSYEVILSSATSGVMLVADVEPLGSGSIVRAWRTPYVLYRTSGDRLMEGCR